jgi:hypothetical protein
MDRVAGSLFQAEVFDFLTPVMSEHRLRPGDIDEPDTIEIIALELQR